MRNLRKNEDINRKPDKGNRVVILNQNIMTKLFTK